MVWDYIYIYIYICTNVDIVREMSNVCGKSNPKFRSDCSETLHFASILKESESDIEKEQIRCQFAGVKFECL